MGDTKPGVPHFVFDFLSQQQLVQLVHRIGQSGGPGVGQLPGCAVAVDGTDAGQAVLFGTQHIMLAVPDHDNTGLVGNACGFQCVGNDLGLVGAGLIQRGTADKITVLR